jgi:hypothetical protein
MYEQLEEMPVKRGEINKEIKKYHTLMILKMLRGKAREY